MDNNEFGSEYLDALQDEHYLILINEKLTLWENMAKSELAKLKYNLDVYSDEANDILIGYLGKVNVENQRKKRSSKERRLCIRRCNTSIS